MTTERLVTAAYAFVPGQLDAAHAAGTYVPADACHRLHRARLVPSRFVTGLDVHGRYVTRLVADGADPVALGTAYADRFRRDLERFGVEPTDFITTDDPRLPPLLELCMAGLRKHGRLSLQSVEGFSCARCGDLSGSEVVDADGRPSKSWTEPRPGTCTRCGRPADRIGEEQWAMDLPRTGIERLAPEQPFPRVRKALRGIADDEFRSWVMTRSRYYGNPMPGDPERTLYLWADSLVSKVLDAPAPPYRWSAFLGKNILPYYGLVLPTLFAEGLGRDVPELVLSARGFCTSPGLEERQIDRFLMDHGGVARARFAMVWVTPDDILDFSLDRDHLHHVTREVLDKVFLRFLDQVPAGPVVPDDDVDGVLDLVIERSDRTELRRLLLDLEVATRRWQRRLRQPDPWHGGPAAAVLLHNVLNAIAPGVTEPPLPGPLDDHGTLRLGRWAQPLERPRRG